MCTETCLCLVLQKKKYVKSEISEKGLLPGEISITSDMQMTPPLWQKVKRNSKAS